MQMSHPPAAELGCGEFPAAAGRRSFSKVKLCEIGLIDSNSRSLEDDDMVAEEVVVEDSLVELKMYISRRVKW